MIISDILLNMKAKDILSAIEELTDFIAKVFKINKKKLVADLMEREKLGSTGIGAGIAIPHVKNDTLDEVIVVFGRSKKGVDFDALDGKPVHLFFLIVAPENLQSEYLNSLAKISRLLRNDKLKEQLLKAKSDEEIIALFGKKS